MASGLPGLVAQAWACKCPRCGQGDLYQSRWSLTLRPTCSSCALALAKNDSADGPAVFLIFVLGFMLAPAAVLLEFTVHPPLWVHAVVWGAVILFLILGSLRPLKSCVLILQFRHRPESWGSS